MSNKLANGDILPSCWIRRPSSSRPNQFYYYNTSTKEVQWKVPDSVNGNELKHTPIKGPPESPKGSRKSDGIGDQSKQIKKRKLKTPAQNRLLNMVIQVKNEKPTQKGLQELDTRPGNSTSAQNRLQNVARPIRKVTPAQCRLQNSSTKFKNASDKIKVGAKSEVDSNKAESNVVRKSCYIPSGNTPSPIIVTAPINFPKISENKTTAVPQSMEIPSIFPCSTPGQDRLNRLRNSFGPRNGNTSPMNESSQQVLHVIQSEFGLPTTISSATSNNNHQNGSFDEDEQMDWEQMDWAPCDIFERIENVVKNFVNPFIIPDTNIFLHELSCIRDTIRRDTKYNVLVPFVVLQELDRLKGKSGDTKVSDLASCAIRFIYNQLKSKTERLQGQKATEDCIHLIDVRSADDKILNCCLQTLKQSPGTILISNDINLCNKAIASGIATMTSDEYKGKRY